MVDSRLAGKWLKPTAGETYTIADAKTHAVEIVKAPDGSESSRMIVGVRESPLRLILNSTSLKAIQSEYGFDSEKWVGRKLSAKSVPMNVRGELKDVIVLTPRGK